jgi:hypothetical protein
MRTKLVGAVVLALAAVTVSCGSDETSRTINVPADEPSIQDAVDRAEPGDIVSISAGTYNEAVKVTTDGIVIRGENRNKVILDGEDRLANGIYVAADGVRVENLTVRSYTQNGVAFNGIDAASGGDGVDPGITYGTKNRALDGYEVRYVTAYNNGLYGIYAFASVNGLIEDSYASGHPDSGVYVGQCRPCNSVIRRVTAELNAIGYYGTNASGNVWVIESTFRRNRLGVAPNSQEMEELAPQEQTVVAGNVVTDNDEAAAPAIEEGFFGGGIIIGGGTRNTVTRNRVENHSFAGIGIIDFNGFVPTGNRIEGNISRDNAVDLLFRVGENSSAGGNCFSGNTFSVSLPDRIESVMPCSTATAALSPVTGGSPVPPPDVDYRTVRIPPPQSTMPDTAKSRPAGTAPFVVPDLTTIRLP